MMLSLRGAGFPGTARQGRCATKQHLHCTERSEVQVSRFQHKAEIASVATLPRNDN